MGNGESISGVNNEKNDLLLLFYSLKSGSSCQYIGTEQLRDSTSTQRPVDWVLPCARKSDRWLGTVMRAGKAPLDLWGLSYTNRTYDACILSPIFPTSPSTFSEDGNQPYTTDQSLRTTYNLIFKTTLYFEECKH